jgi:hypothetical protein
MQMEEDVAGDHQDPVAGSVGIAVAENRFPDRTFYDCFLNVLNFVFHIILNGYCKRKFFEFAARLGQAEACPSLFNNFGL